jgi:hypothetical protein
MFMMSLVLSLFVLYIPLSSRHSLSATSVCSVNLLPLFTWLPLLEFPLPVSAHRAPIHLSQPSFSTIFLLQTLTQPQPISSLPPLCLLCIHPSKQWSTLHWVTPLDTGVWKGQLVMSCFPAKFGFVFHTASVVLLSPTIFHSKISP